MKTRLPDELSTLPLHEKHKTEGMLTPVVTQDGDTVFFACGQSIGKSKEIAEELLKAIKSRKKSMEQVEEIKMLKALIKEASDYLDTNELTTICHSSILHKKFKEAV